jgi:hypothetical protein
MKPWYHDNIIMITSSYSHGKLSFYPLFYQDRVTVLSCYQDNVIML